MMAERAKAQVTEVAGSFSVYISKPHEMAEIIETATGPFRADLCSPRPSRVDLVDEKTWRVGPRDKDPKRFLR